LALTWDTADILDYEEVCFIIAPADNDWHGVKKGDRMLNPVTNALIFHALNTGIGTITAANAAEVYARIHLVEALYGASLMNSEGERPITADDVLKHVGLKTNASFKEETRTSFLKRHAAAHLDDSRREFVRKVGELQAADAK
jgi:hypothetical protein